MNTNLDADIQSFIERLGYQLWGIRRQQRGRTMCLQVFIEHEKGILIDDCAFVSREISAWLDVEYQNENAYVLEVSSPGVDRLLFNIEQFRNYIGYMVSFRLLHDVRGSKKLVAKITQCDDTNVMVQYGDKIEQLAITQIREARLEPNYSIGLIT